MQMLAKPSSICFSTDERPQNISLQDEVPKMPGMCDCKVHDFACGCGARLGYHLLSPCDYCEKEGTKQRWFLCTSCVEAEPRDAPHTPHTPRTPRWADVKETTQKRDSPQFPGNHKVTKSSNDVITIILPLFSDEQKTRS